MAFLQDFFSKKNPQVIRTGDSVRNFVYEKSYGKNRNVKLSFGLRTDIKTELSVFKELLEQAYIDVTEELDKK